MNSSKDIASPSSAVSGDDLLHVLSALANPQRLRIIAALVPGREYVSELARRMGISRPLLHIHLRKLEAAGLVKGELELSEDGKAMKYYEVTDFAVLLRPSTITAAVESLSLDDSHGEPDTATHISKTKEAKGPHQTGLPEMRGTRSAHKVFASR